MCISFRILHTILTALAVFLSGCATAKSIFGLKQKVVVEEKISEDGERSNSSENEGGTVFSYRFSTLLASIPKLEPAINENKDILLSEPDYIKVRAKFTGRRRPLAGSSRKALAQIQMQGRSFKASEFTHEVQIEEMGKLYWIPVRPGHLAGLVKDIEDNQEFIIYLHSHGSFKRKWVYFIEDYESLPLWSKNM